VFRKYVCERNKDGYEIRLAGASAYVFNNPE